MQDQQAPVNAGPPPAAPWTAAAMLASLFLVWLFWPAAAFGALELTGFYRWFYGVETAAAGQPVLFRMSLWAQALAAPFQVLTSPLVLAALCGTRPYQLGLTGQRLGRNLLAGVLGFLVLTPMVLGLYQLLLYLYARSGAAGVEKHPLEVVAGQSPAPAEWVLLVLVAVVTAPVVEEITFRGLLQPWLASSSRGSHLAVAAAFALTVVRRSSRLAESWGHGVGALAEESLPALFVLALVPVYLLVWRRSRTPAGPAVFATALLFASIHDSVWPSPVPLFLLGLGLGWLAWRTRSLAGPIAWHGLFNGVSCVQLAWHLY